MNIVVHSPADSAACKNEEVQLEWMQHALVSLLLAHGTLCTCACICHGVAHTYRVGVVGEACQYISAIPVCEVQLYT